VLGSFFGAALILFTPIVLNNLVAALAQGIGLPLSADLRAHIPLMLYGAPWIRPGSYGSYAEVVDLAPTLAFLLETRPPSGSEGRVLTEILPTGAAPAKKSAAK